MGKWLTHSPINPIILKSGKFVFVFLQKKKEHIFWNRERKKTDKPRDKGYMHIIVFIQNRRTVRDVFLILIWFFFFVYTCSSISLCYFITCMYNKYCEQYIYKHRHPNAQNKAIFFFFFDETKENKNTIEMRRRRRRTTRREKRKRNYLPIFKIEIKTRFMASTGLTHTHTGMKTKE